MSKPASSPAAPAPKIVGQASSLPVASSQMARVFHGHINTGLQPGGKSAPGDPSRFNGFRIARQRLGVRRPSGAFPPQSKTREPAEGWRVPKPRRNHLSAFRVRMQLLLRMPKGPPAFWAPENLNYAHRNSAPSSFSSNRASAAGNACAESSDRSIHFTAAQSSACGSPASSSQMKNFKCTDFSA